MSRKIIRARVGEIVRQRLFEIACEAQVKRLFDALIAPAAGDYVSGHHFKEQVGRLRALYISSRCAQTRTHRIAIERAALARPLEASFRLCGKIVVVVRKAGCAQSLLTK